MKQQKLFRTLLVLIGIVSITMTTKAAEFEQYGGQPIIRIAVFTSGLVTIADKPINFEPLDNRLAELKAENGAVWYFREEPENAEPHANAMKVLDLIIKHQVPVCLSPTADYQICRK